MRLKSLHLFPFYTFPSVHLSRLKFKSGSGKGGSHLRHREAGRLFLSLCLKASFSLPQLPHAEYLLHARLWVKGQGIPGWVPQTQSEGTDLSKVTKLLTVVHGRCKGLRALRADSSYDISEATETCSHVSKIASIKSRQLSLIFF